MGVTFQKEMVVLNSTEHLAEARRFVAGALAGSPFSESKRRLIAVAVDEALTHLVLSAQEDGRAGHAEIRLTIDLDSIRLSILVSDSHNDFYRETIDEMGLRARALGIALIRQVMDEMTYVYRRGIENELKMVKFTP